MKEQMLDSFFETELGTPELFQALAEFLASPHIRKGEFEGNEYVVQKLDRSRVNIFLHNTPEDYARGCREGLRLDRRLFWNALFAEGVRRGYVAAIPPYEDQADLDRDAFGAL